MGKSPGFTLKVEPGLLSFNIAASAFVYVLLMDLKRGIGISIHTAPELGQYFV